MRKVILDCDPGHDDALAILLAAKHLEVLGITTVAGNQDVEKVTTNALKVVEFAALTDIPVAKGMARPWVRPPRHAPEVHGETGLDGPDLPPPTTSFHPRHAVDFIIETVLSAGDVTLIPTGPLTNVATALRREPRLASRVQEISLMGGSLTYGNSTPAAEFNIYVDPEAAHAVFTSGVPIKMCGLNVTRRVPATAERRQQIRNLGNSVGRIVADLLDFYSRRLQTLFGLPGGSLHDPLAVAALIDPDIVQFEAMHVAVELKGEHTYGMTVCDYRHLQPTAGGLVSQGIRRGEPPNAQVAIDVDVERFFALLLDTLAGYP